MLTIGVLGAGHLGKIHISQILEIQNFQISGFFDPDPEKAKEAEKRFNIKRFESASALIENSDVVDIVTPTLNHFECAIEALANKKHIFIEKPLTYTLQEADTLVRQVKEKGVKAQVGHVERFNPAYQKAREFINNPMFIECTRIAEYNPRGTDVSVVLDLMIHDIDIVLKLIPAEIENVMATGVPVISDLPDIANARIEFTNGFVANFTASRASLKKERKMRLFQKNAYITIDFLDKKVSNYSIRDFSANNNNPFAMVIETGDGKPKKEIVFNRPKIEESNAIREELSLFAQAIIDNTQPVVSIEDGFKALKTAHIIMEKMDESLRKTNLL